MKEKVLGLKEFVIVLLLACVETAIALVTAMPFAANLQLVYFLVPGLAGLINGIIYVLLIKKCPKIGTQFIIPMIYGLYFLFTGSVYVFAFFVVLAVVNELIMLGGGYQSKIRPAIPHAVSYTHLFGPGNLGLSQEETEQRVKEAIQMVGLDYDCLLYTSRCV